MEEYLIIGDIAGQYKALQNLVKQMPNAIPVSVGDQIDRGPDSKKVIEFFKNNGKAILGNHEHMLIDFCRQGGYYEDDIWLYYNGGSATVDSFFLDKSATYHTHEEIKDVLISSGVVGYLESLPLYLEELPARDDGLKGLVTHAPKPPDKTLAEACELGKGFAAGYSEKDDPNSTVIWNRFAPEEIPGMIQIFGHNAFWGHCWFQGDINGEVVDENAVPWGVCLDSSRSKKLTGLHWPSLKIYEQNF